MKTGEGPYMQQAGRGDGPKTGNNARMQPLMYKGPLLPDPTDPIGKQSTEPKVETEKYRGTNEQGQSGTFVKSTTTIPGSGGGTGSGAIRTPEGDAAYAAKTPAQRAAQDAKWNAMQAGTPDKTNTQIRFNPDATPLTSKPVAITPSTMPKAPGIKPLGKPAPTSYEIQADMGGGTMNPNSRRSISNVSTGGNRQPAGNTAQSASVMPTAKRTVNLKQARSVFNAVESHNTAINEKYSEKNIRAQHANKGGNLERMLESGQRRRQSNQASVNIFRPKN